MTWSRGTELAAHPPDKPYCTSYPESSSLLWGKFDKYLTGRGLHAETARRNMWFPSKNVDGWGRVVVPCTSSQPGNLYWQARLLDPPVGPDKPENIATIGRGMPRRWESPYDVSRGDAICVVWPSLGEENWNRKAALVEGPMDALACAEFGYLGVALLSAVPSEECLVLTSKILHGIMTLAIMDTGAEDPMIFNAGWLRERGVPCRLINPYPYKDIAACPQGERRGFIAERE